jgi:hypothetical protein
MRFILSILKSLPVPRYYSDTTTHYLYCKCKLVQKGKLGGNLGHKAMGLQPHLLGMTSRPQSKIYRSMAWNFSGHFSLIRWPA